MKCIPCANERHADCNAEEGRSLTTTPCSCHAEHGPKTRIIKRRTK
jgi:hypothetical protein